MLSSRRRLFILMTILISGGISLSGVMLARIFNLSTNIQNPLYFGTSHHARFLYDNGTADLSLDFDSIPIDITRTLCNITFGSSIYTYNVTPEGYYIDPIAGPTKNFSIFWIGLIGMINGTGSETVEQVGVSYSIFDPIGILGTPNTEYNLTVIATYSYWPEEPGLHGAQMSLKYEVHDLNRTQIASGELDYTCGMLFYAYIGADNLRSLKLLETDFDISRNRLSGIMVVIVVNITIPVVIFSYLHFRKKEPREKLLDTTFLVIAGEAVFMVDIMIDVWLYATLGLTWNLILHTCIAGVFAAYCLWRKIGLKWTIPAFMEIAFIYAMTTFTGDSYVPHLTAFMGLIITWLCLIWISGYKRIEDEKKLDKIISEFV